MGSFEILEDVEAEKKLISDTIKRYGSDPEQNYGYFLSHNDKNNKCIYLKAGKYGILTTYDERIHHWVMISIPIAPKHKQVRILHEALDYLSSKKKMNKFMVEFGTEQKKHVTERFKNYAIHRPNCVLYWPVFDMKTWDGNLLEGGKWKKLRHMINRFTKSHHVKIVDSATVDKSKLKEVVDTWTNLRNITGYGVNRKDSNRTDKDEYESLVDQGFKSCSFAKTVLVDGQPASITAGWEIPNSHSYYSAVGVYDYSYDYLGEYANWSDLVMLKKAGYDKVDFGGSPKPLLQFKKKFKPSNIYTTYIFTISKK